LNNNTNGNGEMKKNGVLETFKKFWQDNIKKHYRKISIMIGSTLAVIISSILRYLCTLIEASSISIQTASTMVTILVALESLIIGLTIIIFGKVKNGNGYEIPETKDIVKLLKEDPFFRKYANLRIAEKYNKYSEEAHKELKKNGAV